MHILICDDDAVFAARVETLVRDFFALRGLQVECTVCHSGEETLARRDLDLYQVALLDVDLDTMNGISLGKQLRQCNPEICLVYVSAYLEFAPEGYTVNAFRYILKRDLDCQLPRCLDAILHEQDHRTPKTLTIRQNRTETELPYDSIYYLVVSVGSFVTGVVFTLLGIRYRQYKALHRPFSPDAADKASSQSLSDDQ